MKSARGTVRAGSGTSPLGTSGTSTPRNAKIRRMQVRPSVETDGAPGHCTKAGFTNQRPAHTRTTSGSSFATVTVSTSLAPNVTPRTLIAARTANTAASSSARAPGVDAGDQTAATDPANALATDATAKAAINA